MNSDNLLITGPKRVNHIAQQFFEFGDTKKELRGGSRENASQVEIRLSIIEHIKRLHVTDSHYGREKSLRQYLSSNLNLTKLWRMWKDERLLYYCATASLSVYARIFYDRFNLSFRAPRTDVCADCFSLRQQISIKKREGKKQEVHDLRVKLKLHLLRAKTFYSLLKNAKNECGILAVTFDLQKNLPLPRMNITDVYYKRQLWMYNLGIVIHGYHQSTKDVFSYSWLESESGRGCNEIISALSNFLKRIRKRAQKRKYRKLYLFSDSCGGQNKNRKMLLFLLRYVNSVEKSSKKSSSFFQLKDIVTCHLIGCSVGLSKQ